MSNGRVGRWCGKVLLATAIFAVSLAVASPALALENAKITLNEQTGGVPTRFTFSGTTDPDASIESITLVFPKGFDLGDSSTNVVTLHGLTRVPVKTDQKVDGSSITVDLSPSVEPSSTLRVEVFDVLTPVEGKTYPFRATYRTGDGQERTVDGLSFEYVTPSRGEVISRGLDRAAWVKAWNSNRALSIFLKPQLIVTSVPLLFFGWLYSIVLVLVAFPLAIAGGLLMAFAKMARLGILRWLAAAYVNVIRGTPLFLQIAIAFIGLRIAGVSLNDFTTAIIVLSLNSAAYLTEIFRAGIQSIHKGQFEAASSLGMTYWQAMRFVIIPQTVKRVLPTMTSEFILLFKDTALFSAFGIIELMYRGNSIVSRTGNLTPFVVAAVYYLILTIPLINWVGRLEGKLAEAEGGQSEGGRPKRGKLFGERKPAPVDGGATIAGHYKEHL